MQNDEIMRKVASEYVECYGRELHQEVEALERAPAPTLSELNLERRVRKIIAAQKRRPYLRTVPLLAACIALAVIYLPNLLNTSPTPAPAPAPPYDFSPSPPSDAAPAPSPEPAPPPAAPPQDPAPSHPSDAAPPPAEPGPAPPAAPEMPHFEIIPLSAPLPQGFSQIGFEQDFGKSIYYIEDAYLDDVVITLEFADAPQDMSGFVEISIDGAAAFARQTETYSLLTFSGGEVLYTLTCRHDINTLLRLGDALIKEI